MVFNLILLAAVLLILGRWAYMTFSYSYRMRQALRGLEEALNGRGSYGMRTVQKRFSLVHAVPSRDK